MGFPTDLFIEEPADENLFCVICYDVFERATSLKACGHTFCEECIEALQPPPLASSHALQCPTCRIPIPNKERNPNLPVRNIIGGLTIRCKNSGDAASDIKMPAAKKTRSDQSNDELEDAEAIHEEEGCSWTGKVSDWFRHAESECLWQDVSCDVAGCKYRCLRKDMEDHKNSNAQKHLKLMVKGQVEVEVAKVRKRMVEREKRLFAQVLQMTSLSNSSPTAINVKNAGIPEVNGVYKRSTLKQHGAYKYYRESRLNNREVTTCIYRVEGNGRFMWCIGNLFATNLSSLLYSASDLFAGRHFPPVLGWKPQATVRGSSPELELLFA